MVRLLSFALALAAVVPVRAAVTDPPTINAALKAMGFEADAKQKILAGEMLSKERSEGSDKELAAVVAFRVRAPMAKIIEAVRDGETLEVERDILGFGKADTGLGELGYTAEEAGEAMAALNATPGSKFNFSSAEFERWRALKAKLKGADPRQDPQALEAINAEYRAILADRLAAYQAGGVKAIAPYSRGKKESSPAEELALAVKEALDHKAFPEFQEAITGYPSSGQEHVTNEYLWIKQRIEKRPVMILTHRMYQQGKDFAVGMERQIYVGASYNSQQSLTGGRQEGDAVVVLYGNRCFTDQVAGMGSGLKHGIGRGQMVGELKAHFEKVRKQLEK